MKKNYKYKKNPINPKNKNKSVTVKISYKVFSTCYT